MSSRQPPRTLMSLDDRIRNVAGKRGQLPERVQRLVGNAVVSQMLPTGVVKGGTGIKLRLGDGTTRFTPDVDAARDIGLDLDTYVQLMQDNLAAGWEGFTGIVEAREVPQPEGVPNAYIMRPFRIRLSYKGSRWITITFELGHDEIGSTANADTVIAGDVLELFDYLGLPRPDKIRLIAVDHQVAQKLHACTYPDTKNARAHDLVDLQLLDDDGKVNFSELAVTCERLFASRGDQEWPPTVVAFDNWDTLYAESAVDLNVLPDLGAAIVWANNLIQRIVSARQP